MAERTPDHEALIRLGRLTHEAVADVGHLDSALQMFRDARDVAEARIPGPLGVAVAAVLGEAAYERDLGKLPGSLGASNHEMALALAVLDLPDPKE